MNLFRMTLRLIASHSLLSSQSIHNELMSTPGKNQDPGLEGFVA